MVDLVRLGMTGVIIFIATFKLGMLKTENGKDFWRLWLSVVVFFRWMKILFHMRGLERVGKRMLPIWDALKDIWPFMTVVTFPFLGFLHAYWAIGIYPGSGPNIGRNFDIIWRLGFIGEHDLS